MNCTDCGARDVERWEHECRVADLPRPLVSDGPWSIRETPGYGRGLWKSYKYKGRKVAYFVGATAGVDREALEAAVFEAEEELAYLMARPASRPWAAADAKREFGF